jgi:flagellar biosynthesis anti-sigma factor FlgM
MKIENDKPNALTNQTDAVAPASPASATGKAAAAEAHNKADQLSVSAEAKLLEAAAEAAANAPDVRRELVDKMRALLAQGEIGTDADSLADSLIDDVLKNR